MTTLAQHCVRYERKAMSTPGQEVTGSSSASARCILGTALFGTGESQRWTTHCVQLREARRRDRAPITFDAIYEAFT